MAIETALQTPDGAWRVEIVKRGQTHWYRLVHGGNVIDWLSIGAVERILTEAGVDLANLVEPPTKPADGEDGQHGAA
jgi:bifunctional non-homologous end joining protein LigD